MPDDMLTIFPLTKSYYQSFSQEHTQNPVVLCPRRARRVSGSGRSWTIQRKAALQTLFQEQFGSAALKGNLLFPFLTTGCVEVAADGKTAKGTWRSPCVQAVMPKDGKGEPQPIWLFGAYAGIYLISPCNKYVPALFKNVDERIVYS